jgi:hypothetical protein
MIHTPHRDKKRGTTRTMDVLIEHKFDPAQCVVDHNNEETVREVLDRGFWAAFFIYPGTKMGNVRMTEVVRQYGAERIIVDSACDWGVSDALALPKTARLMIERGISADAIRKVSYDNALAVYGLAGEMKASDWLEPVAIDQRTLTPATASCAVGKLRALRNLQRRAARSRSPKDRHAAADQFPCAIQRACRTSLSGSHGRVGPSRSHSDFSRRRGFDDRAGRLGDAMSPGCICFSGSAYRCRLRRISPDGRSSSPHSIASQS